MAGPNENITPIEIVSVAAAEKPFRTEAAQLRMSADAIQLHKPFDHIDAQIVAEQKKELTDRAEHLDSLAGAIGDALWAYHAPSFNAEPLRQPKE